MKPRGDGASRRGWSYLSALAICPRRAKFVADGAQPDRTPQPMLDGQMFHAALADFYRGRIVTAAFWQGRSNLYAAYEAYIKTHGPDEWDKVLGVEQEFKRDGFTGTLDLVVEGTTGNGGLVVEHKTTGAYTNSLQETVEIYSRGFQALHYAWLSRLPVLINLIHIPTGRVARELVVPSPADFKKYLAWRRGVVHRRMFYNAIPDACGGVWGKGPCLYKGQCEIERAMRGGL